MRKCWEMGGKMDLRIEKTERGIKNAFIELRSRKPLEKITVKELCESARINKSTFYAHYKDIYDLSDAMEEEVVQSIANSIQHPEYLLEHPAEFARELLMAYVSQNSLTAILFSGSQANHFADSIERSIKQMIFEKYPELKEKLIEELEQIKSAPTEDSKLKLISKGEIKSNIGRSPDISDMVMMRMYFEIKPKNIGYLY